MLEFVNMIVPVLMLTAAMTLGCMEYLHMLQLESYQLDGYRRWIAANKERAYVKGLIVSIVSLLAMVALSFFAGVWTYFITSAVMLAASIVCFALYKRVPAKKKLVLTKRVQRLLAVHAVLWALVFVLIDVAGDYVVQLRALPFALPAVWVWTLALSARIAQPMENAINKSYFRDAQKKLQQKVFPVI